MKRSRQRLPKESYNGDLHIKIDINETGCESVDLFRLAQDRGHWRGTVMKLGILLKGVGCVHRLSECQVLKTDCSVNQSHPVVP